MSPFVDKSSIDLDVTDFFKETLDNIHKELAEAGQLKKIEFRKS
jgi:hypothetical protein